MKPSILSGLNPLTSIALFASIFGSLPAFADAPNLTYNGANVYKDAKGMVYKVSTAEVKVGYGDVQVSKSAWSDACGVTRVSFNATSGVPSMVTFNGTTDTLNDLYSHSDLKYKCTNGVASWGNAGVQTTVAKSAKMGTSGETLSATLYYPSARTGGGIKQNILTYTANVARKVKPICGFVMVDPAANSQKRTSTALSLDGTAIDLANLPVL